MHFTAQKRHLMKALGRVKCPSVYIDGDVCTSSKLHFARLKCQMDVKKPGEMYADENFRKVVAHCGENVEVYAGQQINIKSGECVSRIGSLDPRTFPKPPDCGEKVAVLDGAALKQAVKMAIPAIGVATRQAYDTIDLDFRNGASVATCANQAMMVLTKLGESDGPRCTIPAASGARLVGFLGSDPVEVWASESWVHFVQDGTLSLLQCEGTRLDYRKLIDTIDKNDSVLLNANDLMKSIRRAHILAGGEDRRLHLNFDDGLVLQMDGNFKDKIDVQGVGGAVLSVSQLAKLEISGDIHLSLGSPSVITTGTTTILIAAMED